MSRVVRGGFWLYIGVMVFNISGFIYWLAASLFLLPEDIGVAAAIVAAETLLVSFSSFGVGMGIRGLAAEASSEGDTNLLSAYVSTALVFSVSVGTVIPVLVLVVFTIAGVGMLTSVELLLICVLTMMDSWPIVLYGLFISLLRSEFPAVADISLSTFKLAGGMLLILGGFGLSGLLFGLVAGSLAKAMVTVYYCRSLSRQGQVRFRRWPNYQLLLNLLRAGFATWVPNTLATLGQSVGILMVYGSVGGSETGTYYIALAVSLVVYKTSDSLQSLMFPLLSSMKDGRKRAAAASIRISFVVSVPLALALLFYPDLPFSLLGPSYSAGSTMLQVLLVGAIAYPVLSGYSVYVYALKYYWHVAAIGTIVTVTRLVLYYMLTVPLGELGTAFGYAAGVYVGIAAVFFSASRTGFRFEGFRFWEVFFISALAALVVFLIRLPPWFGVPLTLVVSLVGIVKLRVISKEEVVEVSTAFMSKESVARIYSQFRPLLKYIFE